MAKPYFQFLLVVALLLPGGWCKAAQRKASSNRPAPLDPSLARQRKTMLGAHPLILGYYIEDSLGANSAMDNARRLTAIAPQCFVLENDGIVRGAIPPQLAALAQRHGLPVLPLVVNPDFDRKGLATVLRSPKLQERTASYLAYLARRGNFVGWQLDFERIDPDDKARYSAFVKLLATKLHRDGRLLSVAVTPRFSDAFPDDRKTPFRTGEWGAGFDFQALGAAADFVVLMAYDQHTAATPPGPVAGHDWVRAALEYAVSRIPPHKLVLGIPLYGREWVMTPAGQLSRSMNADALGPILGRPDAEEQWDERWRSPWIQFRAEPDAHTVWYENKRSLSEKLSLVSEFSLRGVAAWRLGHEGPDFWTAVSDWVLVSTSPPAASSRQRSHGSRSGQGAD
jgi:spore germination protein YaaH